MPVARIEVPLDHFAGPRVERDFRGVRGFMIDWRVRAGLLLYSGSHRVKMSYRRFSLPVFAASLTNALTNVSVPIAVCCALLIGAAGAFSSDWPRFRGPNGAGVNETTGLPTEFGSVKNLIWRTPLPNGYSSPILVGDRIYLTGYEGEKRVTKQGYVVHDHEKLLTFALDRATGRILWRREAPLERTETIDARNSPASPTPVSDGKNLFVFFGDYGLVSYGLDGNERWHVPLGPFTNVYGIGVSPVLVDDKIILVIDQSGGSYIAAFGQNDGKQRWKVARPEALSGHSTPSIMRDANGKSLIVAPASFRMDVYSADTGEIVWFMHGLASEMKSVPRSVSMATPSTSTATILRKTIPAGRSRSRRSRRCSRSTTPTTTARSRSTNRRISVPKRTFRISI